MKRILIIEDHEDTLNLYQSTLQKSFIENVDYILCACETGAKGLEAFYKAHDSGEGFDLIITDLEIDPQKSGISVIKAIQSIEPEALIVIATGNSSPALNLITRELGIKHLWTKPIENFGAKVGELLGMKMKETADKTSDYVKPKSRFKIETLTFVIVVLVALSQIRSTWMSPKLYLTQAAIQNKIETVDKKLDGAVSTHALPKGYRVTLPDVAGQGKVMKSSGNLRMIIEFDKDHVLQGQSIIESGGVWYVEFTKEKK